MFQKVVVKDSSLPKSPSVFQRILLTAIVGLLLSQTTGCITNGWSKIYEESVIKYRDMVWAKRAYNLRYSNCNRDYSQHFENGFQAGYSATCDGGDGYVPALPPQAYRGYEYQSSDGARCVNSWFEGYPAGVAAARNDSAGTYNDVLISRLIDSAIQRDKTKVNLPKDIPVVKGPRIANELNSGASSNSESRVVPTGFQSSWENAPQTFDDTSWNGWESSQ